MLGLYDFYVNKYVFNAVLATFCACTLKLGGCYSDD